MLVGIVIFITMAARNFPAGALPFASPAAKQEYFAKIAPDATSIAQRRQKTELDLDEAKSSWSGAYRLNTREYLEVPACDGFVLPLTVGLMMIGLYLFKTGFFAGRSTSRRYATAIATGTLALVTVSWLLWQKDVPGTKLLGSNSIGLLLAPLISLGYASALILTLRVGGERLLKPVASAGRMAFTNSLSQSLIMTSIFYGGRGKCMGAVNRRGLGLSLSRSGSYS